MAGTGILLAAGAGAGTDGTATTINKMHSMRVVGYCYWCAVLCFAAAAGGVVTDYGSTRRSRTHFFPSVCLEAPPKFQARERIVARNYHGGRKPERRTSLQVTFMGLVHTISEADGTAVNERWRKNVEALGVGVTEVQAAAAQGFA